MKICLFVNYSPEGVIGIRARKFAEILSSDYETKIVYKNPQKSGMANLTDYFRTINRARPDVLYIFDIGRSSCALALFFHFVRGAKVVIDIGDLFYELAKLVGKVGFWRLQLIRLSEIISLKIADAIVVRGSFHKKLLEGQGYKNVFHIPDCVDTTLSRPLNVKKLRRDLGLNNFLTVGFVGTISWSEKLQMCYGWELVETLKLLKDLPVKGIIVGGGDGLPVLKRMAEEYDISDKVLFLGRIPYTEVPKYLNLMDVCLLTQANHPAGMVRTTGKLPEYLACGRYILATNVGEASLVLPESMLLAYEGVKDEKYPIKLAEKIREIYHRPEILAEGEIGIEITKERFDYRVLSVILKNAVKSALKTEKAGSNKRADF